MSGDVIAQLLPALGTSRDTGFNVFDVMHHGTHEKQLSNVFSWLLNPEGSHQLGDRFQQQFIQAVNAYQPARPPFGSGPYLVRQEVNTSALAGGGAGGGGGGWGGGGGGGWGWG